MKKERIIEILKETIRRKKIHLCHVRGYGMREQIGYNNGMIEGVKIALSLLGELDNENVKCGEKKEHKIVASADGRSSVNMELTEEQYKFLDNVFDLLNDNGEPYAPYFYIDTIL